MVELFEHQKEALDVLLESDYLGVLDEQGLGKTLPMLYHIATMVRFGYANPNSVLIVAPLSALGAWQRDTELLPTNLQQYVKDITYINYDKLSRKTNKARDELYHEWDIIVLDEAHAIAKTTSNRTKYFIGYKKRGKGGFVNGLNRMSKYRYILTGTLITNGRLQDLYSPLEFLNPNGLGDYNEFANRYLKLYRPYMATYDIVVGYRNVDELLDYVGSMSIRRLKKDRLDLPEKFPDTLIKIPITAEQKRFLKQANKGFIDTDGIEILMDNALVRMSKCRQLATGFIFDEQKVCHRIKNEKLNYAVELMENILPNKVVFFCEFTNSITEISEYLDKKDIKYVTLDGKQKNKQIWREFQEDDTIKVIIANYESGNSGIDLFSSTHTIFYEPPQSTTVLEQARDRTHRNGVKSACNYYFLLTEGTIEESIYDRLAKFQDFTVDCYASIYEELQ